MRAPGQDKPSASLQAIAFGDAISALSRSVPKKSRNLKSRNLKTSQRRALLM